MYSTYNEGKSVIAERFLRTFKGKIYKKMTANDGKPYLSFFNKLVDQNIVLCHPIGKKPINAYYSALTKNIGAKAKAPKFKVSDRVRIIKYKNIFSKNYTKNWSRQMYIINSVLKNNTWTYKIKDLKEKK